MERFSIIVPVKKINNNIEKLLDETKNLTYRNFEVIILPDDSENNTFSSKNIRVIPTGEVGPAIKRNIGAKYASGDILAFLDDDAYPKREWLEKTLPNFRSLEVGAVGGPAITPKASKTLEKASGKILESFFVSGQYKYRYVAEKKRLVDDFPSVNLLVRKSTFDEIGGFSEDYWPGEDTLLCKEIVSLGYTIVYDPEVVVWHKRRALLGGHLKQIAGYALHRGYFAKRHKETSLRPAYFIPSMFLIFVVSYPFLSLNSQVFLFANILMMAYLIVLGQKFLSFLIREKSLRIAGLVSVGILLTHLTYGLYFLKGITNKELGK